MTPNSFTCCFIVILLPSIWSQNSEISLHYRLHEERPIGTRLGNLFTDANLHKQYDEKTLDTMSFRFLSKASVASQTDRRTQASVAFEIDKKTQDLKTSERVDRDQLCPDRDRCVITVDIALLPMKYFQLIKVSVEIVDINDNFPTFPETALSHDILESALPGTTFPIPAARDPDSRLYGIHKYEIIPGNNLFDLRTTNKVDGSTDVRLVLKQKLDRERKSRLRAKVVAFDGGDPPKSGSIDVIINVIDTNDNNPHFVNNTYRAKVLENAARGSTLVRVSAHDPDHGQNGKITYGFSDRTRKNYGKTFSIKNNTGEILVLGSLDYEKNHVFQLVVVARDQGAGTTPAEATVIITLIDENDNKPEIQVNTLDDHGSTLAELPEDAALDTFVAHVTVVDPDSGRFGEVNCSLNNGHFRLIRSGPTEYQIVTATKLDREKAAFYSLELLCKDRGPDPQITVQYLRINIKDVNDHAPIFDKAVYQAQLRENNYIGTLIITVNATDLDAGRFGKFRYKLEGTGGDVLAGASQLLEINPTTGSVRAMAVIDREKTAQIKARLLAVDNGNPPRTGSAALTVNILDINDEAPSFERTHYTFRIYENQPALTKVGTVKATDFDTPPHAGIEYSLLPTLGSAALFTIDPESGEIKTKQKLDREQESVYTLVVLAKDSGNPPQSSSVTVQVPIADENDNVPVVEYPSTANNTIQISNRVPRGFTVTRVRAHDRDVNQNGRLLFDFARGNDDALFSIDKNLGTIQTAKRISKLKLKLFELTVSVKDRGIPPKATICNLNIVVNQSIVYNDPHMAGFLSGYNLTIVVGSACATGLVTLILTVCIVCLRRNERSKQQQKYNCRMEALKMLNNDQTPNKEPSAEDTELQAGQKVANGTYYYKSNERQCQPPRKEVRFCQDDVTGTGKKYSDLRDSGNELTEKDGAAENLLYRQNQNHKVYPKSTAGVAAGSAPEKASWTLAQNEMEVHQLVNTLRDHDADSAYSGEGSNTDSGRGHSLEDNDKPTPIPEEPDSAVDGGKQNSLKRAQSESPGTLQTFGKGKICPQTTTSGKLTFSQTLSHSNTPPLVQSTCSHGSSSAANGVVTKHDCISRWHCTPYSKTANMPLGYHTVSGSHGNIYGSRSSVQSQHSHDYPIFNPPPPIYEKYNTSPYASRRCLLQGDVTIPRDSFGIPTAPLSRSTVASKRTPLISADSYSSPNSRTKSPSRDTPPPPPPPPIRNDLDGLSTDKNMIL